MASKSPLSHEIAPVSDKDSSSPKHSSTFSSSTENANTGSPITSETSNESPSPKSEEMTDRAMSPFDPIWDNITLGHEEDERDYKIGGFHPVKIGERFHDNRYLVVRKLGWGQFSTSWLVHDQQLNRRVCLKVAKSSKLDTEAAKEEIELHQRIASANPTHPGSAHVVSLLDHFEHQGPNGIHFCMVFELLGEKLSDLNRRNEHRGIPRGIPVPIVREVARQILLGLDYLHRECGIIHADIKPDNILVCVEDAERVIHSDLENPPADGYDSKHSVPISLPSDRFSQSLESMAESFLAGRQIDNTTYDTLTVKITDLGHGATSPTKYPTDYFQTRQYRSPEIIIGTPWDRRIDMWSAGCTIFELLTGTYLFPTHHGIRDESHTALIIDLIGPFPEEFATSGKYSHLSERALKGELGEFQKVRYWEGNLEHVMRHQFRFDKEIFQCLNKMLQVDPSKRCEAKEILDDKEGWLGRGGN